MKGAAPEGPRRGPGGAPEAPSGFEARGSLILLMFDVLFISMYSSFFGPGGPPPLYVAEKVTDPYGFVLGNPSILKGPRKPRKHNKSTRGL